MTNQIFALPNETQAALYEKAAKHHKVSASSIEKDIWVCWLLQKIFQLPEKMAFKGGTSLSKVYGLINRFSEDIDITIDYRNFLPEMKPAEQSRSQLKKLSNRLKENLKDYLHMTVAPYLQKQILDDLPNKNFELNLSEDGEQLKFYYPTSLPVPSYYLRDHVLLEFGIRNDTDPNEVVAIKPYLSSISDERIELPIASVCTLSPIRTFWEKATLIHVECHRNRLESTPERLSRHWYDMHVLSHSWVMSEALKSMDVFLSVIEHKKAFFNTSYANYGSCLEGGFRLCPDENARVMLSQDYDAMFQAGMFNEKPPKFSEILETMRELERKLNTELAIFLN